jgi:serine kinase of HPr protein (carbohydrate metabolism regulator)
MSAAVHASAVLVGERGVLIRGVSGAGKSLMALALVGRVRREGGFAALVADDRVWLDVASERLIVRGAPRLAGLCERRCEGLVEAPHETRAVLRLIVDLPERGVPPPRMPEESDLYETLNGIVLPRLRLDLSPGLDDGVSATISALARIDGSKWRKNVNDAAVFA